MAVLLLAATFAASSCSNAERTHAYEPKPTAMGPSTEGAFIVTCFSKDAFEDKAVEGRASGALEGLIRIANGHDAASNLIFSPDFATKPTIDHDLVHPFELNDALNLIRSSLKVDYRRRGNSNIDGYAVRYLSKAPFEAPCLGNAAVCNYDAYTCGEISIAMSFFGPRQVFRIRELSLGPSVRWTSFRSPSLDGTIERLSTGS